MPSAIHEVVTESAVANVSDATLAEGAVWWPATAQFIFVDYISLVCLMIIAVAFEWLHERAEHFVKRDRSKYASPLWHRINSEFMVLGFIAFIAWIVSRAGGFVAMARALEHHFPLMEGEALLLLVEDVHMRLFMTMLLYFFIMVVVTYRAERHIRGWCHTWESRKLKISSFGDDGNLMDHANPYANKRLQLEYHNMERKMIAWLRDQDFSSLHVSDTGKLAKALENFNLSAYLTTALEEILLELVHISNPVWLGVSLLYLVLGLTSGYASASDEGEFWKILGIGYFVMAIVCILLVYILVQYRSVVRPGPFQATNCLGKVHAEILFARALQIGLFFSCYSILWLASAEPSRDGYLQEPVHIGVVIALYYFPFFLICCFLFPYLLPRFCAVVRLPPFVDKHDMKLILEIANGNYHHAYLTRIYPPARHGSSSGSGSGSEGEEEGPSQHRHKAKHVARELSVIHGMQSGKHHHLSDAAHHRPAMVDAATQTGTEPLRPIPAPGTTPSPSHASGSGGGSGAARGTAALAREHSSHQTNNHASSSHHPAASGHGHTSSDSHEEDHYRPPSRD